jgi:uncharacterized protein YbjT (DUF2867 family)
VGLGYYEAKTRQEELIRNSAVPWSLLKATQFHEFLDGILSSSARFLVLPGGEIKLQPIAAAEVGARLSQMALSEDARGEDRIAGPEVATLGELAAAWKSANARRAVRLKLPLPGSTGRNLREGALTDPGAMMAGPAFPQWLKDSPGAGRREVTPTGS